MEDDFGRKIESEINKAKLSISDARMHFLLAIIGIFAGIFGIVVPLFQSSRLEKQVEDVVEKADKKIDELNSIALRKPNLVLLDGNVQLQSGSTIVLNCMNSKVLELKNIGDGKVEYVKIRALLNDFYLADNSEQFWSLPGNSAYEDFRNIQQKNIDVMYPNEYLRVPLNLSCDEADTTGEANGKMEIFYSEPKELAIKFKILKSRK
jgi:hypothetical protein